MVHEAAEEAMAERLTLTGVEQELVPRLVDAERGDWVFASSVGRDEPEVLLRFLEELPTVLQRRHRLVRQETLGDVGRIEREQLAEALGVVAEGWAARGLGSVRRRFDRSCGVHRGYPS